MLLRRFTQHVKEQNWFAVGLDFLIVVGGIYIGLQVDAWRVSQNERVQERQYLERLLVDMEGSIKRQLDEFELEKLGIESMDIFAGSLANKSFTDEAKLAATEALNFMGWVTQPYAILITIRELQSSGNISLIQNLEVRNAIGQLEHSFSSAMHSAEQTSNILNTHQSEIIKWAYLPASDKGQWGYEMIVDFDYVLSVPYAEKIVSNFSGWFKYHSSLLHEHHADTLALMDLVKKELEETP